MGGARGRILIVEDDDDIRDALSELLDSEGWPHQVARDPDDAVAALARIDAPALILSDLFPAADGDPRQAVLRLRAAAPAVPLVIMTAAVRQIVDRVRSDVTEVLPKPFRADAVLSLVRRICS